MLGKHEGFWGTIDQQARSIVFGLEGQASRISGAVLYLDVRSASSAVAPLKLEFYVVI